MNIIKIQEHFKRRIEIGNYQVLRVTTTKMATWLEILVDNRPFCLQVTADEVTQSGDISENYLQLGSFTNNQKIIIYERTKRMGNYDKD